MGRTGIANHETKAILEMYQRNPCHRVSTLFAALKFKSVVLISHKSTLERIIFLQILALFPFSEIESMCESIKDVAPHGQWLQYIWAQDCQYQMLQIYCIIPKMLQIYFITPKCHNFDILLDIGNINTFFWMPCGMNSFSAENCCKKYRGVIHTYLIKCCIMSHGLIWDTMPYEFQAQGTLNANQVIFFGKFGPLLFPNRTHIWHMHDLILAFRFSDTNSITMFMR